MKKLLLVLVSLLVIVSGLVYWKNYNLQKAIKKADAAFANDVPPTFWGDERVSIIPLIIWHSETPDLKTEAGVSYLIQTDNHTILFDLGYNAEEQIFTFHRIWLNWALPQNS